MPKRVLILSASIGHGHTRAAQAIQRALTLLGHTGDVRHEDVLPYTNPIFRTIYRDVYLGIVERAPAIFGWLFDRNDKPNLQKPVNHFTNWFNTLSFARMVRKYDPDVTVCTHFLPSEVVSHLKKRGLKTALGICVTDLDCHAIWMCPRFEQYFVSLDETAVYLQRLGVPADKVSVTGVPIDPVFAQPRDRAEMRRLHNLDPNLPVILVSTGGLGSGPGDQMMDELLRLNHPAQVLVVCGHNKPLKSRMEALAAKRPADSPVKLIPLGFTDKMHEYMSAADLLVGKAGGLTVSETLATGLPLLIINPIPGQEERNSDHLLEQGAALRCNNLPALAFKIDRLLADPPRLAALRAAAARLGKPNAATDVARLLLTLS